MLIREEIETMEKKVALTLILIGAVVGSGMIVYNADELYLSGRSNVVAALPARLVEGHDSSIIATAYDLDGEPVEGKEVIVTLETENKTYELFKGKTDSTGSVQPMFSVPYYSGDAKLVVSSGKDRLSQRVKVESNSEGEYLTKILITTDKPIYQPDQIVHIRTLTYEGVELKASERPVEIEITDSGGNKIFRRSFVANEFGIANLDYALSDQLPLGTYKITARVGEKEAQKSILVEEYVLPKFKIDVQDTKSWYTIDESVSGKVTANYFFGKVVEGTVNLEASVYKGYWDRVDYEYGQLTNGEFPFTISSGNYAAGLDLNSGNGILNLTITVTDTGGHKEEESHYITIAAEPIQITTLADTNVKDTVSTYYIIARYPNGVPVDNALVEVSIGTEAFMSRTDDRGITSVDFTYTGQNKMIIDVSKSGESTRSTIGIMQSMGIKVVSDKSLYDIGEVATFKVFYTGEGATNLVYYEAVSQGFVITTGRVKLKKGSADFEIPITPDMSPSSTIRVYKIEKDSDVVRDNLVLLVSSPEELNVTISTDEDIYTPNEDVKLEFHISNTDGPVYSAVGISGVDQSVFEISRRFSGFEEVFWGLEEEFLTPQYQIINYVFDPAPAPLPVDSEEEISKGGDEKEIGILSTLPKAQEDAKEVKTSWEESYWGAMTLLLILGYFGLFALAIKYKAAGVVAIFLLILVVFAFASVLYVSTSSMQSGSPALYGDEKEDAISFGDDEGGGELWNLQPQREDDVKWAVDWDSEGIDYSSLSNLSISGSTSPSSAPPTHIRSYFPETWYWNPALITDENGYAFVTLTTPDTITTWGIDAIASTKDAQMGTASTEITVFQEFFVEPDIPISVIRNDEFPLRVLVYNYDSVQSNITVELQEDAWFELLSDPIQYAVVEAQGVSGVDFVIKAKEVGEHNVTIDASTQTLADKIVKEMRVDPDGKSMVELVNGQLDDEDTASESLVLSAERVPNSEDAYVKLQGGIEAVVMDGAEDFIVFVSGCGEQSTSRLSVDIAAYKNLLKSDVTDEKLFEYEDIINKGIQHELIYLVDVKDINGNAIVWHTGESPDIWLTAWAIFAFQDLLDVGFTVDEDIIDGFQRYLVNEQESDGSWSFPDVGHWSINDDLQNENVAATAYILRALLYSHYPQSNSAITRAVNYLRTNIDTEDSAFTTALALCALEDADDTSSIGNSLATRLENIKNEEDDTVFWSWSEDTDDYYSYYRDHTVETTGYAIMALYKHSGPTDTVNKAVKYLLTNREGGRFGSTHDTAVAFQALDQFGSLRIDDLTVDVNVDSENIASIRFTEENKDITYLVDLRPYLGERTQIELVSQGSGSVLFQIYLEQFIPWDSAVLDEPSEMELSVTYDSHNITVNDYLQAQVHLKYTGSVNMLKMVLVDLRAPVGFSFESQDFDNLLSAGTINQYEIQDRQCVVYIDNVEADKTISFSYRLKANLPIRATIQGINAYDMYNPNLVVELDPVVMVSTL
jgi:uncharacterized protein YfaS (alpha-2-macroglobulin family)